MILLYLLLFVYFYLNVILLYLLVIYLSKQVVFYAIFKKCMNFVCLPHLIRESWFIRRTFDVYMYIVLNVF